MGIKWISEAVGLPRVGQTVLHAAPRQSGEFWDISTVSLMARHEGVVPKPVEPGSQWPTDYFWGPPRSIGDTLLVTGNGYWARIGDLELPPGAEHRSVDGSEYVAQVGEVFVPQKAFD